MIRPIYRLKKVGFLCPSPLKGGMVMMMIDNDSILRLNSRSPSSLLVSSLHALYLTAISGFSSRRYNTPIISSPVNSSLYLLWISSTAARRAASPGRAAVALNRLLPGNKLDMLIQKTREFVLYNQKVDRIAGSFEGMEGEETHKNFTTRLMMVVERLEGAAGF